MRIGRGGADQQSSRGNKDSRSGQGVVWGRALLVSVIIGLALATAIGWVWSTEKDYVLAQPLAETADPGTDPEWQLFLPVVGRGAPVQASPTLGPSPTPTKTPTPTMGPSPTPTSSPTSGPSPTATPTPIPDVVVMKMGTPDQAHLGETIVYSIGFWNHTGKQVQIAVSDTLPDELDLVQVWNLNCPTGDITTYGDSFTAVVTVPADPGVCQLVVRAVVEDACDCYVVNSADWDASWSGGSDSGRADSIPPIFLTSEPTPTPTSRPISPTPTVGPSTTPTRTSTPTLGPSPTPF